jgi:hypothetical protein
MVVPSRRILVVLAIVIAVYGLAGFFLASGLVRGALLGSLGRTLNLMHLLRPRPLGTDTTGDRPRGASAG